MSTSAILTIIVGIALVSWPFRIVLHNYLHPVSHTTSYGGRRVSRKQHRAALAHDVGYAYMYTNINSRVRALAYTRKCRELYDFDARVTTVDAEIEVINRYLKHCLYAGITSNTYDERVRAEVDGIARSTAVELLSLYQEW